MGASFNYVVAPKNVQSHEDVHKFYEETKQKLYEEYGEDFEGYTGDLACDNDELEIKENLCLKLENYKTIEQNSFDEDYNAVEQMIELIEGHAEKWGPSLAVRVNDQWIICGFYSD